jgi:hypothetical protein
VNGTAHAGLAVLSLVFVAAIFFIRYAVTPAPVPGRERPRRQHRGPRQRRVEEYVPAAALIPAFAGAGWPQPAFAHCIQCRSTVPVLVHHGAHRCDAHGHVTTHTTTGSTT